MVLHINYLHEKNLKELGNRKKTLIFANKNPVFFRTFASMFRRNILLKYFIKTTIYFIVVGSLCGFGIRVIVVCIQN